MGFQLAERDMTSAMRATVGFRSSLFGPGEALEARPYRR